MSSTLERPLIASEHPLIASQDAPKKPAARIWLMFLVGGLAVAWLYPFVPRRGVVQSVIAVLLPAAAVVALLVGIRVHQPERRGAWYLMSAAQTAWVVAAVIWFPMENLFRARLAFPSIIDVLILGAYPAFVVGLWVLMRTRSRNDRGKLIDSSVITVGIGLLLWIFLMSPTAAATGLSVTARAASLGYPIMDILLIACVMRFAVNARAATPALLLIVAFFGALLVGDVAFLAGQLIHHGIYEAGGVFDSFWWSGFVLLGAAGLHPSMHKVIEVGQSSTARLSRPHLIALGLACLIAPLAVVMVRWIGRDNAVDDAIIAAASGALFLLVLARMYGLISNLRTAETERQRLVAQIMRRAEAERSRIADEIHDVPIQRLAALSLRLAAMSRRINKGSREQANSLLEELETALSTEIDGLRRLMVGLRPPSLDQAGLRMAVEDQIEEFYSDSGAPCSVDIELLHQLSSELETTIFRVIQEALRNAAQHSGCSQASVAVCDVGGVIEMNVHDDGSGFSPERLGTHHGFGLASMREHVRISKGQFDVVSSPGHGTTVKARFSLDRDLS